MTAQTDRLNAALAGRYRILSHLGEGGMASVYLCEDLKHERKVALKLLKPELAAVLGADRFVVEIKTTASLQHPHILPLFDSGTADGFLFYVMPFIEGETLRAKLSRETQLGVEEAVRIAREVLDALEYAHHHGIVHRDVKPENILLHGGHAMVADFGIALAVSAAAGGRMTETGLSLGTPHYMSPEQATAEKEITARSDVYSLGSVLYEMLAGQPPHLGGSAQQIIMKIIAEPVAPVTTLRRSVPANVAAAVAKALEKLPADRFESAKAFSEALANPAYTHSNGANAAGFSPTLNHGVSVSAVAGIAGLALLVGVIALVAWLRTAQPAITHERIVLWDNQQIPPGRIGRGFAISPDGRTLVFVDGVGPAAQLYAKERDHLAILPIAGTTRVAGAPVFSPDGEWIAFVTIDGRVQKIPRGGGSGATIADSADPGYPALAWLEGGTILYLDAASGLRAVGQDGGAASTVLKAPTDTAHHGLAGVRGLPGGKAAVLIACSDQDCSNGALEVLDLRTRKTAVLTQDVVAAWPLSGGVLAFARKDGGVFAAPFDDRTLAFTRSPVSILDGVRYGSYTADMAVSANGTLVYVVGDSASSLEHWQPVWVTRAGAATAIDSSWTTFDQGDNCTCYGGLALSPDGRRLALNVWRGGANSDIYVKQLDQVPFALVRLTFSGDNYNAAWAADGRSIIYAGNTGNNAISSVRRQRADGSGSAELLLAPTRNVVDVIPTRDTTRYVLRVGFGGPHADIVLGHLRDSTTTPLVADSTYAEVNPELSPDGRWLAYASYESGRWEVYVRPYPDVKAHRWQVSQAGGVAPRWAHSGRELFFRNHSGGLVSAAIESGSTFAIRSQTTLFDARAFLMNMQSSSYDVAPGDQRFVFMRAVGVSGSSGADKLVEVTNWATEVRAKLEGKAPN